MQITIEEIERHAPDVLLPPDPEFADLYAVAVEAGREIAARSTVAMVAICRNAMPWLPRTLDLVERTGAMFKSWAAFVFENDSTDGTKDVLAAWADHDRRKVSLNINHRPHLCGEKSAARTDALAAYRTECQQWVASREPVDYVIVFDSDAWGGWSVDGVATSLYWLDRIPAAATMASYSWCEMNTNVGPLPAHYDAWAARLNHWRERDHGWFHHWHPAVGSIPVRFNSAFGQLAVYRHDCYARGRYAGGDCEHVLMHRSMGGPVYLNPSSRCVSFWVPNDGGQHKPD